MPPSEKDLIAISNELLQPHNLQVTSCQILQNLWAGYGVICRLKTDADTSLILKYVSPPGTSKKDDEGHIRKVISYQVERHFYENLAPQLPKEIAVAQCLGSRPEGEGVAMVLQDLSREFAVAGEKRGTLGEKQVLSAVRWLGGFHGFWWGRCKGWKRKGLRRAPLEEVKRKGEGVWLNGGYTYLATRRKEYASLKEEEGTEWEEKLCRLMQKGGLGTVAEVVASVLAPSPTDGNGAGHPIREYETLIHGDVKSENLFTTKSGDAVAFFDFQYVGLGLGVCDLAKLFTCSVPESMLTDSDSIPNELEMGTGERRLLEEYRKVLDPSGERYPWETLERHWQTALVDWLRFQASWGFWGNTEWLEARVRNILKDEGWRGWVLDVVKRKD